MPMRSPISTAGSMSASLPRTKLPDFCSWPLLFAAAVVAELGVVLPALAPGAQWSWPTLGLASLFAQWNAALIVAVWCFGSNRLQRLRPGYAILTAWLAGVAMSTILTLFVLWVDRAGALGLLPPRIADESFVARVVATAAILSGGLLRYIALQQRWLEQRQHQAQLELRGLQARLRPHFLYNAMNTIASMTRTRPADAERAIEDLCDLLRDSLETHSATVPLERELALCRKYLRLSQWRMGDRLSVDWRVPDSLAGWRIPPLTLQTLVENAVLHGVQERAAGGAITIVVQPAAGHLVIEIRNPVGTEAGASGIGTALGDLRRRLELVYAGEARLEACRDQDEYRVVVRIPEA